MEPSSLVTGSSTFDHILAVLGALVPVASALASLVNHRVRKSLEAGEEAPKGLLAMGSMLNVASINVDKAVQLAKMFSTVNAAQNVPVPVVDPSTAVTQPAAPATCPTCGKALA